LQKNASKIIVYLTAIRDELFVEIIESLLRRTVFVVPLIEHDLVTFLFSVVIKVVLCWIRDDAIPVLRAIEAVWKISFVDVGQTDKSGKVCKAGGDKGKGVAESHVEAGYFETDDLASVHDWVHSFVGIEEPTLDEQAVEGLKIVCDDKEILVLKTEHELTQFVGDIWSNHTIGREPEFCPVVVLDNC